MSSASALAREIIRAAAWQGVMVATAESCTGGLAAAAITSIAGSSQAFDRGFVTYSDNAKMQMLGVSAEMLKRHGAVSRETAAAMATGALKNSSASIAVSITGIAGPGGGSAEKPVGLVWFGLAKKGRRVVTLEYRFGAQSRARIRALSVVQALELLRDGLLLRAG